MSNRSVVIVEVHVGREVLRYRLPLKQARKIVGEMLFGLAPFTEHGSSRKRRKS
jgi:hypothetical protein